MDCPWCDGDDTERIGAAGSLLMTEQWFCRSCDSPFEVIRKRGGPGGSVDTPPSHVDDPGVDGPSTGHRHEDPDAS